MKVYNWDTFTCCSGTYIQNIADYHNLIYYREDAEAVRQSVSCRRWSRGQELRS